MGGEPLTVPERVALYLAALVADEAVRLVDAGVNLRAAVQLATFRSLKIAAGEEVMTLEEVRDRLRGARSA